MYNILIVDDEYLARNTLHFLMDWTQYGFQIASEASSAKEAIALLESSSIDVVFTDIYMPDMDGIELARYIYENHSGIGVVIFSNYSDFNYVKGAFSANVIDYVLKHTITAESMANLLSVIQQKHTRYPENNGVLQTIEREKIYRTQVKQAIFNSHSNFLPENVMIIAMGINNHALNIRTYSESEQDMLYQNIENTIAKIISDINGFVIFRDGINVILYLPFGTDRIHSEIMNLVSGYIRQINSAIYKFFNLELLWGISILSSCDYTLKQCYEEACNMLTYQPSKGQKFSLLSSQDASVCKLSIRMERSLINAISDLNITKVHQCLDEIFNSITSIDRIDILINDLASVAAKFYDEFNLPTQEIFSLPTTGKSPIKYQEWAKNLFSHIINTRLQSHSIRYKSGYVHSAMEYIAQNYNNDELSLGDIAKHIGVSEQHLSKVFKIETGKNLSAYLVEYRIERAKELLRQNTYALKWIHSKVGFSNNSYFSTVFKKYEGCSPKEYQKKHMKI